MSLTAALNSHCRVQGESNSDFLQALKALTPEDKQWFRTQFKIELDITID